MSILMQNLKLFLRLPNCASVGEKNFDNSVCIFLSLNKLS